MGRKIVIFIVVFLLVFFCYRNNLRSFFVADDWNWFPQISEINPQNLAKIFLPEKLGGITSFYYRPINPFFFWLNYKTYGFNPFPYHLTNLVLHFLNILLVYLIASRLIRRKWTVLFTTFLFAVFPFHSETVAWVSGQIDVLSSFFYLLSLLLGLIYLQGRKRKYFIVSLFAFVFALLTKENTITLPVVLFILEKKPGLSKLKYYLLIVLIWLLFKSCFSPSVLGPLNYHGFFLSRVFIIYLGFSVIGFLFLQVFVKYKKLFKYWVVLGVVLLPTAFLPTEERYLYLPSVFFSLFLGVFLAIFSPEGKKKIVYPGLIIFIFILAIFLYQRNQRWVIASDIAQKITAQIKKYSTDENTDLYFLSLPDNYKGAFLFRTHFDLSLKYNGVLFNKAYLLTTTNGVGEITLLPVEKNTLLLQSSKKFIVFAPSVTKNLNENQFEIKNNYATVLLDNSKNTALIKLNVEDRNFRMFYFNNDQLVEFP